MQVFQENDLDVTVLEPRQKHPTIFNRFDALSAGQSLTIHNDHDPKPLYYQLLGERGNIFTWEYLEQGPEWWRVRISKRTSGEGDETLGALAAKDLRKAEIFKKYGLDFCCGGKKTVKEACAEKGLDVTKIEQELQQADKAPHAARPLPYGDWSLDFLADYIVNTHHSYVRKTLPEIRGYARKVAQVHGNRHPELVTIHQLVEAINEELTHHLGEEENVVFPFIKKLVAVKNGNGDKAQLAGTAKEPIALMEEQHEQAGKLLEGIRTLSQDYTLPQDACASYSLLFRMLQEFEEDLHLHIHLENNILFPKTLELEKSL